MAVYTERCVFGGWGGCVCTVSMCWDIHIIPVCVYLEIDPFSLNGSVKPSDSSHQ